MIENDQAIYIAGTARSQCASEAQSQRGASPLRVGASYPKPEVTALPQGRVESNGR